MRIVRSSFFTLVFSLLARGLCAQGSVPDQLIVSWDAEEAAGLIKGSGIGVSAQLSTRTAATADGSPIVWIVSRDVTDIRSERHIFFRQFVATGDGSLVPVLGPEVGVHSVDGKFRFAGGRQFTSTRIANRVIILKSEAHRRALAQLQASDWDPESYESLTDSEKKYRDLNAQLVLFPSNVTALRFAYKTYARRKDGDAFHVYIDADDGAILGTEAAVPGSNCAPTAPTQAVPATGIPVRGVGTRNLIANPTVLRGTFSYEGHDRSTRPITIFQQTGDVPWECQLTGRSYTVFPVRKVGTTPTYDDYDPTWHGTAAADAMFRTRQTMNAFWTMGINGWDGGGGVAQVVVDSDDAPRPVPLDSVGGFIPDPSGGAAVPSGGAVVIRREANGSTLYNLAAALDQVAHEWGHGLIFKSANFPTTGVGKQLHEGFADVIGQMVEKLQEPSGGGVEHSDDWDLGEDQPKTFGAWAHSGTRDDGEGGHAFGPWIIDDKLHKDDESPDQLEAHERGNMLNVVYKMLTAGGKNPICTRANLSGCNYGTTGEGVSKASAILFNALVFYMPSNTQWSDLATYTSQAAFDLYADCTIFPTYPARAEQNDVNAVFTAIGYPRTTSAVSCQ